MNHIGSKIAEARHQKGFSQEELAKEAGINLRTLQRIETGENEPRGSTLRFLCEALDIQIEDLVEYNRKEDPGFLRWFYLSTLLGCVIPLGNLLIPMILWLTNRNKVVGLQEHGRTLINFQIVWSLVIYGGPVLAALFMIFGATPDMGISMVYIMSSILLGFVINIVWVLVAVYRTKETNTQPVFPSIIPFIRA
ncbi:MAG: helix-turn-helix domain-containing protein [Bacteroidota bacterium]